MTQLGLAATATLVHGFSMADVDRAAGISHTKYRYWPGLLGDEDRKEAAWHGIVEHLYACGCGRGACTREGDVAFADLLVAGMAAIGTEIGDRLRHHGRTSTGAEQPSFGKYWLPVRKAKHWTDDGFSDQLCDRLAIRDAMAVLTPTEYEAIAAEAAFGNGPAAADALGLNYQNYRYRLEKARRRVKEVWVGDTPAEEPAVQVDACKRGHPRAEHGVQITHASESRLMWRCTECARMTSKERQRRLRARRRLEREEARVAPAAS